MNMYTYKIKLANKTIEITNIYSYTKDMCKDYISNDEANIIITTTQSDIDFEREKSISEALYEGIPIYDYSDDYLESVAVYRKIAIEMLNYNTTVFHGAVVAIDDDGYLFTAKSGTGKTTHMNLWLKQFDDCIIINGDKPLIMIDNNQGYVCGSPWAGKEGYNTNKIVKLKGICILERDTSNHIEKITFKEAMPLLMQQIYRPTQKEAMKKVLQMIHLMGTNIPIYRLGCNMEDDAAIVSRNGMQSNEI